MIARVWHGWTTRASADEYEALLRDEVFPSILDKRMPGFLGIELFRRELGQETEFMTVMKFASPDAITAFVGDDHGVVYVPDSARRVLARFDERAAHYEARASRGASPMPR